MNFLNKNDYIHPNATHFRYDDGITLGSGKYSDPLLHQFKKIRDTPAGCWIIYVDSWTEEWGDKRWVSNTARRRYAYPTLELAAESYRIRKEKQILHCKNAIKKAEAMILQIKDK